LRLEIIMMLNETSVSANVYDEGREDHINDQVYELFALEEVVVQEEGSLTESVNNELPKNEVLTTESIQSNDTEVTSHTQEATPPTQEAKESVQTNSSTETGLNETTEVKKVSESPQEEVVNTFTINLPTLNAETKENAYCTHIESAVLIKCQLSQYEEKINVISESLPSYAESVNPSQNLKVGDYCIAKYTVDETWYRSQVLRVTESDISVEFIDYGNTDSVNITNTRPLNAAIAEIPRTCIDVQLSDVHVTDISISKTKAWLEEKLTDQVVVLDIINWNNNLAEAVVNLDGEADSVNDQIYQLFATEVEPTENVVEEVSVSEETVVPEEAIVAESSVLPEESNTVETEEMNKVPKNGTTECQEESSNVGLPEFKDLPELPSNSEVTCTFVESAIVIHCRLQQYESYVEEITLALSRQPTEAVQPVTKDELKPGKAVLAKSNDDGFWYRAKVLKLDEDLVSVKLVDYGFVESLPLPSISKIDNDKLLEETETCIPCTLQDVVETDVDAEKTKAWLQEKVENESLTLRVETDEESKENFVYAYFAKNLAVSINDQIYEQFPLPDVEVESEVSPVEKITPTESSQVDKPEVEELNPTQGAQEFTYPILTKGDIEGCVCTVVESSTLLRCQLTKYQNDLEKIMELIANENDSLESLSTVKQDQVCIAPYHQDLGLYRARVLSVSEATSRVEFVDYGNIDDVINEDFRIIKKEMLAKHVFCMKCSLTNVKVLPEFEQEVINYLNRTFVETCDEFKILIDDITPDNIVNVTITHNGKDINQYLNREFGMLECKYRQPEISLGDKIEISIPNTDTLTSFWCQINNQSEALGNLMKNMSIAYEKNLEVITEFQLGMPCCALNINNGTYFRGIVEQVEEVVAVRYADFGIVENTTKNNVFKLLPKFFKLPILAFKGCLFDLRPIKNTEMFSEEAVNLFNQSCKNVSINATVVSSNENGYALALVLPGGDTIYELLTQSNLAKTQRKLDSPLESAPIVPNGSLTNGLTNGHDTAIM